MLNLKCNLTIINSLLIVSIITVECISSFTYIMGELIWHQPCSELSHHLSLVIYSLDGDENLSRTNKRSLVHYRTEVNKLKTYHWGAHFIYMSNT